MREADLCWMLLPRLSVDLHWGRVQKLDLHLTNMFLQSSEYIGSAVLTRTLLSLTSVACPTRCGSLRPTWKFETFQIRCDQRILVKLFRCELAHSAKLTDGRPNKKLLSDGCNVRKGGETLSKSCIPDILHFLLLLKSPLLDIFVKKICSWVVPCERAWTQLSE